MTSRPAAAVPHLRGRRPTPGGLPDALLGAALVVALVGTAVALAGSWGGTSWLLDLLTGVVVGLLALRRHARPGPLAVAGSAVAVAAVVAAGLGHRPHEPGPATVLGLTVLLASAIRRDGPRAAAVPAWCGLAVVVAAGLRSHAYVSGPDVITVLAALGWLTAVAAGLGLRLRDAQRRAALEEVRRDERLDLARELHDLAAHHLTGLVLQAQAARIVARTEATRVDHELAGIESSGADALNAIRRVVGLLREPPASAAPRLGEPPASGVPRLGEPPASGVSLYGEPSASGVPVFGESSADAAPLRPGPPSLDELIGNFRARPAAPDVRATITLPAPLPPEVATTVHRIVQEGLTNVVRHAPDARMVDVAIRLDESELTVTIADDGPPRAYQGGYGQGGYGPGGYGLIGMTERVQALGGDLAAGPRPGGGWQIRATLRVAP